MIDMFIILLCNFAAFASDIATISAEDRFAFYEKAGLGYAKQLYQDPNSKEIESKSNKTELLNIKIREKTIESAWQLYLKSKDPNLRRELLFRLAILENEQSESFGHLPNRKNNEETSRKKSINYYRRLLTDFSGWKADLTLFRIAEAEEKLRNPDEAMRLYTKVIKDYPQSSVRADSLLALGNLYFDRKAFGIAKNTFALILNTPEKSLYAYAHYKEAWCYFNSSDSALAISELESAIHESRQQQKSADHRLGIEEEALSDLVLFFAESTNPLEARAYFEKIVDREKAKSMRFDLARRLFDYGKHLLARNVATDLLADNPNDEYTHKLYLILISVAERLQDHNLGIETAKRLTQWLEKHPRSELAIQDSEEYLRLYAEKLHHEAETTKKRELWGIAKSVYEIYLAAFSGNKEQAEIQFRYAVLLFHTRDFFPAYVASSTAITQMKGSHPRYKESLRLRIQAIEACSKEERKSINDKQIIAAYDEFSKIDLKDPLSAEAAYKAAEVAKNIETPEQVSQRFQAISKQWPNLSLAKNAAQQSLSILIENNKWDILKKTSEQMGAASGDSEFNKKIQDAHELAQIKIFERLEKEGKFIEAKAELEAWLKTNHTKALGIYALSHLADLAEKESAKKAIPYLNRIQMEYPDSNEAKNALLKMAKLNIKLYRPKLAVDNYLSFAGSKAGEQEELARQNAAILLENLGDHLKSGTLLLQVSDGLKKRSPSESAKLYEAGCTNLLLASGSNKSQDLLSKLVECSNNLAVENNLKWQARAAWASEQLGHSASWAKLAHQKAKEVSNDNKFYLAMAKIHLLESKTKEFKTLKFSKSNEKPLANIAKKSDFLDAIEKLAGSILEIASPKQIILTQNTLRDAYLDFADTMTTAALPTHSSEKEKSELKKSFMQAANNFEAKAKALATPEFRQPASQNSVIDTALAIPELSTKDEEAMEVGTSTPEILAKVSYARFKKGDYSEAHYFYLEWQKSLSESHSANPNFGEANWQKFGALLGTKIPDRDPLLEEI